MDNEISEFLPTGNEPGPPSLGRNAQEYILAGKAEVLEELAAALQRPPELELLRAEVDDRESRLEELRSEYANGRKAIGQAASAGNAERLSEITLRLQNLPALTLSAEFACIEARLRLIEAEKPIVDEVGQDYNKARIGPLQEEMARLAVEIRRLESQRQVITDRSQNLRERRIALRNRHAEIVAELQHSAMPFRLRR